MITPEVLTNSPEDMRLIADVVAERAKDRRLPRRKAYQVARRLNAEELLECYRAPREEFLHVFGPHYNRLRGESDGPLFAEVEHV